MVEPGISHILPVLLVNTFDREDQRCGMSEGSPYPGAPAQQSIQGFCGRQIVGYVGQAREPIGGAPPGRADQVDVQFPICADHTGR